jgi:hypothetical protein
LKSIEKQFKIMKKTMKMMNKREKNKETLGKRENKQ